MATSAPRYAAWRRRACRPGRCRPARRFLPASGFALASKATPAARWCWSHCCPASRTRGNWRKAFFTALNRVSPASYRRRRRRSRCIVFLRAARVNGSVDQRPEVLRRDAAVTDDVVGAAIVTDDVSKTLGRIGVQQNRSSWSLSSRSVGGGSFGRSETARGVHFRAWVARRLSPQAVTMLRGSPATKRRYCRSIDRPAPASPPCWPSDMGVTIRLGWWGRAAHCRSLAARRSARPCRRRR